MKKLKEMFFSERGMGLVNMLFCLSLLIRVGWLTVMTYLVWAAYLVFCIKHAESKASRHQHRIFGDCSRPLLCEPVLYVLNIQAPP